MVELIKLVTGSLPLNVLHFSDLIAIYDEYSDKRSTKYLVLKNRYDKLGFKSRTQFHNVLSCSSSPVVINAGCVSNYEDLKKLFRAE